MDSPVLFGLKKSGHFKIALSQGTKWITRSFILVAAPIADLGSSYLSSRDLGYGVVASKKVGNAVCRNKAKRRLREIIRAHLPIGAQPGYVYVFIARHEILTYPFDDLPKDLGWALKRLERRVS
jgi:ribonuclease P protein component